MSQQNDEVKVAVVKLIGEIYPTCRKLLTFDPVSLLLSALQTTNEDIIRWSIYSLSIIITSFKQQFQDGVVIQIVC